jgi:hypothetical protein
LGIGRYSAEALAEQKWLLELLQDSQKLQEMF